jgi:hypothetical protein
MDAQLACLPVGKDELTRWAHTPESESVAIAQRKRNKKRKCEDVKR